MWCHGGFPGIDEEPQGLLFSAPADHRSETDSVAAAGRRKIRCSKRN